MNDHVVAEATHGRNDHRASVRYDTVIDKRPVEVGRAAIVQKDAAVIDDGAVELQDSSVSIDGHRIIIGDRACERQGTAIDEHRTTRIDRHVAIDRAATGQCCRVANAQAVVEGMHTPE